MTSGGWGLRPQTPSIYWVFEGEAVLHFAHKKRAASEDAAPVFWSSKTAYFAIAVSRLSTIAWKNISVVIQA